MLMHQCMLAKTQTQIKASPLLADAGYSIADPGHWKTGVVFIVALFLSLLLITQSGYVSRLKNGADIAFSRARQLLHEADDANRKVRPLPLSLAESRTRVHGELA
jgi:hypothetical protein